MKLLPLAYKSICNRRGTAILTVLAIAFSVTLLLGVEKVRKGAKLSFMNTISGTSLIVGPRTGSVQLLLYSVFRIGSPTIRMSWESYERIAVQSEVEWTIPLSLGESHQGYRVLGTTDDFFKHYKYANRRSLAFDGGKAFHDVYDTVMGADVAKVLGYKIGDEIEITHGLGHAGFSTHKDRPFHIVGILAKTGTPVDRTVHVSLEGLEAVHIDWVGGAHLHGDHATTEEVRAMHLKPESLSAMLIGLKSPQSAVIFQYNVNNLKAEPLLAVMPAVALQELWDAMSVAETAFLAVSGLVVIASLLSMITVILAGLNERRREMAILRSVGARPLHVFGLLVMEAGLYSAVGAVIGLGAVYLLQALSVSFVEARFGLYLPILPPTPSELLLLSGITITGFFVGAIPGLKAYSSSVADGMMVQT